MRALVTGGTGLIGNRLVLHLARNGWEVTCLVRRPVRSRWEQVDCAIAELDGLGDPEFRRSLPERVDSVFHLGATPAAGDWAPTRFLTVNATGTSALLELAEALKATAFVNTSTQLVIGKPERVPFGTDHPLRPESAFALSKLAGEMVCELFRHAGRVATTSLRVTSVIGLGMPAGRVLPLFTGRALRSENLTYQGAGARVQNFVHADDVVSACMQAASHPGSGILNAGGADSLTMKELAEMVVRSVPGSASQVIASGNPDPQDDYRWIPELKSAETAIGYSPRISLEAFLPEFIDSIAHPKRMEHWWDEA